MPENQDEFRFLDRFWEGASRETVIRELHRWGQVELLPIVQETIQILKVLKDDFHKKKIRELRRRWPKYEDRFVVDLDDTHQLKAAQGLLEKMVREWVDTGRTSAPLRPDNYRTEMPDAIRLRFIVNFLSDGQSLFRLLCRRLSRAGTDLNRAFDVDPGTKKCSVHTQLNKRSKGERSWKIRLIHRATRVKIELQVCTQFQVAWDKKEHFMIYEPKRIGVEPSEGHLILMRHLSDQLYVVDRELDEVHRSVLDHLEAHRREDDNA